MISMIYNWTIPQQILNLIIWYFSLKVESDELNVKVKVHIDNVLAEAQHQSVQRGYKLVSSDTDTYIEVVKVSTNGSINTSHHVV